MRSQNFAGHRSGMEKPEQRPEGKLVQKRLKEEGRSIRSLVDESGYSEGRLRQVINGYASAGKGQYIAVTAPDEALAKIAWATGLTVSDLRSVGRSGAADVLVKLGERWLAQQRRPAGNIGRVDTAAIKAWAETPLEGNPPDGVLELFEDDALIGEIKSRMSRYRVDINDYAALVTRLTHEVIDNDQEGGSGDGEPLAEKNLKGGSGRPSLEVVEQAKKAARKRPPKD